MLNDEKPKPCGCELTAAAVPYKKTGTDDGSWDGPANEAKLKASEANCRAMYAWVDPKGNPDTKAAYKFAHHVVGADGSPGPANMTACSATIAVLNGGRGGSTIPTADKQGVYNHVRKHLIDGGSKPADVPELMSIDTITADTGPPAPLPETWHAILTVEGLRTTDHRAIARGALDWRQLPLPLFAQFANAGHEGADLVGSITGITRENDLIMGEGTFDLSSPEGCKAAQMCADQVLRWVSVDLEVLEAQNVEVSVGGESNDLLDLLMDSPPEGDFYTEVLAGRVCGATMCAIPAFQQAVICPTDMPLNPAPPMGEAPMVTPGMVAAGIPVAPPAEWFADPMLAEVTPLTVSDDGRVFGHLALWNSCHIGFKDSCVVPPHSSQNYAYFLTGKLSTAEGTEVRVGQITYDTGHAGATMGWQDTASHYDNTGAVAADVTVGEDSFGIWVAGAARPGTTPETMRTIKAHPLSGDWRKIGGSLELVAALCVTTPGFPVVASGMRGTEQVSLVAAGPRPRSAVELLAAEVATLRRAITPLLPLAAERLSQAVNGPAEAAAEIVRIEHLRQLHERVELGGAPNPGTPADKRLRANKPKMPMKATK